MSAGLTQTKIEAYVRHRLDAKHHVRKPDSRLSYLLLLEFINETHQEVSRECCLIKTCYHWKVTAGTAAYGLELTPSLFVRPYSKKYPLFWKGESLYWRDHLQMQRFALDYAADGTPEYGCLEHRGKSKGIMLLPAPGTTEGDGTAANDPLHFFAWRLPKPIESTGGIPEIDGDLHYLIQLGTLAKAAEHLEDARANGWKTEYDAKKAKASVVDGIRRPVKAQIGNIYANVTVAEPAWDGAYDEGVYYD